MEPSLHLPSGEVIAAWPVFSATDPLKIMISACLAGFKVGTDGSSYGDYPHITELLSFPSIKAVTFCPEDFSFGTPRAIPDIHGGDGHDVLAGRARVLNQYGEDWTDGMVRAAHEMLRLCRENDVRLAVMMDISAACGSQVIYGGTRPTAPYLAGRGVSAALLVEAGIYVVSQRDWKTLDRIFCKLDPNRIPDPSLKDHHEIDWYNDYFSNR